MDTISTINGNKPVGIDDKTLALITDVQTRRAEIARIERPKWTTNCSFSYTEKSGDAINLHVESSVRNLILIAAFLLEKEAAYFRAAQSVGVKTPPAFTWHGFAPDQWLADIEARIEQVQVSSKRKKLDQLEERLNAVISPELRRRMELDAIAAELD